MLDRLTSDVVLALRSIRAAPAMPLAAVLTTSLGVGINLAMAGLIDRALLSPPAHVAHPEQIFTVGYEVSSPSGEKGIASTASYLTYEAVQSRRSSEHDRERHRTDEETRASSCASIELTTIAHYFAASRRFTHSSEISTAGLHQMIAA